MLDRPQRRIRFVEHSVHDRGDIIETRVALLDGDKPCEGMVQLPSGEHRVPWAAAEATVAALRLAHELEADALVLKDVVTLKIDGHPAVATSIVTTTGGEPQSLFGLARIVEDEGQAAALATLGATNRFFGNG